LVDEAHVIGDPAIKIIPPPLRFGHQKLAVRPIDRNRRRPPC
jgi:hypothetical protein